MSQILKKFRLRRAIFTLVFLYKISFRGWNPKKAYGGPLSHQDYQLCHARSVPTLSFHGNMMWTGMAIRAEFAQLTGVDEFDRNASAAPYHTVTGFRQRLICTTPQMASRQGFPLLINRHQCTYCTYMCIVCGYRTGTTYGTRGTI